MNIKEIISDIISREKRTIRSYADDESDYGTIYKRFTRGNPSIYLLLQNLKMLGAELVVRKGDKEYPVDK